MKKEKLPPPTGNETADMSVYMSALMERYKPALFGEQATHWFSTDEVLLALRELNPSANIKQGDVYQAMWNAGFRFGSKPGTQRITFQWMLVEKNE